MSDGFHKPWSWTPSDWCRWGATAVGTIFCLKSFFQPADGVKQTAKCIHLFSMFISFSPLGTTSCNVCAKHRRQCFCHLLFNGFHVSLVIISSSHRLGSSRSSFSLSAKATEGKQTVEGLFILEASSQMMWVSDLIHSYYRVFKCSTFPLSVVRSSESVTV